MSVVVDFSAVSAAMGEGEWHDLPFGVRFKIRPQTGLVEAAIQAQIARDLYEFRQGGAVVERYGFSSDEAGLLAEQDIASGFAMLILACVRGNTLIEEWNLVNPTGEAIPISLENVTSLFHLGPVPGGGSILMASFQRICDLPSRLRDAEKNGSGSSRNGATAAELTTAPGAASAAPAAPLAVETSSATGARKRSTSRKRRTA